MKGDKLPEEVASAIESVPASPSKTTKPLTKPVAPTASVYKAIQYTPGMWGWVFGYKATEEDLAKHREQFEAAEKAKQDAYQEALRTYQAEHPDEVIPELQIKAEAGEQKIEAPAQTVVAANSEVAVVAALDTPKSSDKSETPAAPELARKRSRSASMM